MPRNWAQLLGNSRIWRDSHDEDLVHGVPESGGQFLKRAGEARDVGQLPVKCHQRGLRRACCIGRQLRICMSRLHRRSECGKFEPKVVNSECLPVRVLLCGPGRRAFVPTERGVLREQRQEALTDADQHLCLRGGSPEVDEPLKLGGHTLNFAPLVGNLTPQTLVLNSQVCELRLQSPELRMFAQDKALVQILVVICDE